MTWMMLLGRVLVASKENVTDMAQQSKRGVVGLVSLIRDVLRTDIRVDMRLNVALQTVKRHIDTGCSFRFWPASIVRTCIYGITAVKPPTDACIRVHDA